MKSDVVIIDNPVGGFDKAMRDVDRVAVYEGLNEKQTLRLEMLAEEMLGIIRSVSGEIKGNFWIETRGKCFVLHFTTQVIMDSEKRQQLISVASSRKNEAAKSFRGLVRDFFEQLLVADADHSYDMLSREVLSKRPNGGFETPQWDGYERSILRRLADDVKVSIVKNVVELTVSKAFED